MQIRRILVAVDSSPASERALRAAVDLAGERGDAKADLVHVAPEPTDYLPLDRWIWGEEAGEHALAARSRETARQVFAAYLAALPEALRPSGEARLEFGVAADRIVEIAREGDYDLVVMGTHGRKGASHLFLGSVAERVIARAPCPVLVVR